MPAPATSSTGNSPRIIKARAASGLGTPIAFNYRDLQEACDEHLAELRDNSQQLLDATTAEAERLRREAAEAGRKAGYQDGLKAAEAHIAERVERMASERLAQQLETVLPAVRQLADHLVLEQDRWVARWEREAVHLAVAIAEKLLHCTLRADPSAADAMIADALRVAAGSPMLIVRIAPLDFERLGGAVERIAEAVGRLGETAIVGDARVTPGGCLIETKHGQIDARLETMLTRIASELCSETSSSNDDTTDASL
ncbi:MAG: FliH/SctL family protein [Planctomycetota bacterium]|nr:hypothetical protein [Planctomycetaceae bacterium]MDQ3330529.1 FliH/SctL family protein [Planctomycetota bacterium]